MISQIVSIEYMHQPLTHTHESRTFQLFVNYDYNNIYVKLYSVIIVIGMISWACVHVYTINHCSLAVVRMSAN